MEVEIRTVTGIWVTEVDGREFATEPPGAAARSVSTRIQAGEPIEVSEVARDDGPHPLKGRHMALFNPGHVVSVVETRRLFRS